MAVAVRGGASTIADRHHESEGGQAARGFPPGPFDYASIELDGATSPTAR